MNAQNKITITANGKTVAATLVDNSATEALLKILPVTVEMSPYGGFEMVGALPQSLPTSNSQISTEPGDIMLYQGNQLVIFFGNNSWSYTRLGKIDDATSSSVRDLLGNGKVNVTLSLFTDAINEIKKDEAVGSIIYDLQGRRISIDNLKSGIYVIDGNKVLIK